jgi:hypothetical protein
MPRQQHMLIKISDGGFAIVVIAFGATVAFSAAAFSGQTN